MPAHRHAIGLTRRELIQVGYSGLLGMGLGSIFNGTARAAAPAPRVKSVVLIFRPARPATSTRST